MFDNYQLSIIIEQMMASESNFYQSLSVQRVIEHQFQDAKLTFKMLFLVYTFLYILPLVLTVFSGNDTIVYTCLFIAALTQIFFLCIEIIQIIMLGIWEYINMGIWNYIDLTQFFVYGVYSSWRIAMIASQTEKPLEIGITKYDIKTETPSVIHM